MSVSVAAGTVDGRVGDDLGEGDVATVEPPPHARVDTRANTVTERTIGRVAGTSLAST
jgi:hypothetical protein